MAANDLGSRGRRLWKSLLAQDDSLTNVLSPMREVALSACRAADRVDQLEKLARQVDPLVDGKFGQMVHPIFGEVRQQEALLARLVSALRLPDEASGRRPQHRSLRGVQKPSRVSARDRLRAV